MKIKNTVLKGCFLVGIGAISYGMLATFVKLAYKEGFTTAEVTTSQFVYGILGMLILSLFIKNQKQPIQKITKKSLLQLVLAGTSMGMTSVFYYLCVKYITVSVAIVMLMQSVWIGVFIEAFLEKKTPNTKKIIAVLLVLVGTVLATNSLNFKTINLDFRGVFFGFLAAISFATTMFTANRVALELHIAQRSLWMLLGGGIIVFGFAVLTQNTPFNMAIFYKWGILLALFGTIIPPLLLNAGFPKTGIGLGSIISSLELPVSVCMAFLILNETIFFIQWIGVGLILFAIVLMNVNYPKK